MAAKAFNLAHYTGLLSETHPTMPRTEKENQRLIAIVNDLTERPQLPPEEEELVEVLLALIQTFENQHYKIKRARPHEVLREMMRANDLQPKDLYQTFGSKGNTSEVLSGKRAISKSAAKALAKRFATSADLFL